jgi:predicted transcriptional regulator
MAQTKFDWEDLQTPFEIIDEWNRDKDKTDADLINFVKKLGIDDPDFKERRKKEWTSKEKSKKTTGFFENIKDRYEDTMMKLHGAEEVTEPYLHEGDWFRRKYTKAPGSRGLSLSQLGESERRDKAHKEFMLKKAESEVKEKEPELSMWQKIGKHFGENADKRDQLFSMLGSMGRELVKPIEPGKAAAGALLPTLSRGLGKGEEEWAAKEAATVKQALDMATARQKINPLQYYSSKMSEARLAVPSRINPDSAEGKRWIGNYLKSVGIPSQVVDLTSSLESLNLQILSASSDEDKKRLQSLIDQINRQIEDLVSQSIGGSSVTNIIPYSPT